LEKEIGDAAIDAKLAELEGPLGADLRKPQEAAAQQKRAGARSHIPEPALGDELLDDSDENEDLGAAAEDDLVDFGFEPEKQ